MKRGVVQRNLQQVLLENDLRVEYYFTFYFYLDEFAWC